MKRSIQLSETFKLRVALKKSTDATHAAMAAQLESEKARAELIFQNLVRDLSAEYGIPPRATFNIDNDGVLTFDAPESEASNDPVELHVATDGDD